MFNNMKSECHNSACKITNKSGYYNTVTRLLRTNSPNRVFKSRMPKIKMTRNMPDCSIFVNFALLKKFNAEAALAHAIIKGKEKWL